ncbi:DUF3392 domain-containing protein [Vibrio caribbeanicus]|uniref:DUF3392 domain-containing protein n=1 Tax=Vibrio caribbeanicus TaxID=701175 RepID=UPI002285394B|nr:DUF3392 domain-containing protein [Vibrio caribbeanicus]MCY9844748.1 DUF3392 domain-containing protein [Vibrio caribbeanicus]
MNYLNLLGSYTLPYMNEISTALIACVLVMAGGSINALLRKQLGNANFIIRTVVFILVNAFGYGLLIVKATPMLSTMLRSLDKGIMFLVISISFVVIGIWAQRNRQV